MNTRIIRGVAAALLAVLAVGTAWAHGPSRQVRPGVHVGRPAVGVGVGVIAPRPHYYYPNYPRSAFVYGVPLGAVYYGGYGPYYGGYGYYPPAPVVAAPPVVYVEQSQPGQAYWYWCADPQGYYPDVPECANGWQAVAPRPAESQ